jgi:hypothetical protein
MATRQPEPVYNSNGEESVNSMKRRIAWMRKRTSEMKKSVTKKPTSSNKMALSLRNVVGNQGYETNVAPGRRVPGRKTGIRPGHTVPVGTVASVYGPGATFGGNLVPRGVSLGNAIIKLGVGIDSAIGSIFEDEALVLPDPHLPIRLKQANFFAAGDSDNRESLLSTIILKGGAYTSFRISVAGFGQLNPPVYVPPSGGKGDDIEIDWTLITEDEVFLAEFKKGYGAQKKGDAVQMNRAAICISYHFQKLKGRKPRIYSLFVAGAAIDARNIDLPDRPDALSRNITSFSRVNGHLDKPKSGGATPFVVRLVTSEGFANFAGFPVGDVKRMLGLRAQEHEKYFKALEFIETIFTLNPETNFISISNAMRARPNFKWPNFFRTNNARTRVDRLVEMDIIPSLVFKKREYEKTIKNNRYNRVVSNGEKSGEVVARWLGIIEILKDSKSVKSEFRRKYQMLYDTARSRLGATFIAIKPNIDNKEQILLRSKYLGSEAYKVNWPIPSKSPTDGSIQCMLADERLTPVQRILTLRDELKQIVKSQTNIPRKLLNFGRKVVDSTLPRNSKAMQILQSEYNNQLRVYIPEAAPRGEKRKTTVKNWGAIAAAQQRRIVKPKKPIQIPLNSGPLTPENIAIINKLWSNSGGNIPFAQVYRDFISNHARLVPAAKRQLNTIVAAAPPPPTPKSNDVLTAEQYLANMRRVTPQIFA